MTETNTTANVVTLPSEREILMTRVFNAPRELVFRAHTDAELIPQWWGLRDSTTIVDKLDFQPDGAWRFIERSADGAQIGFNGVFREVSPPERLTYTFEYEGMPGHISVNTLSFDEQDGKTTLTSHIVFDSAEDRDGMLQSGMEWGANQSHEQLDELLETLL
ncbi:MAG: SRPBCC family protein [Ardenticatenales bacterium]|nr:SRPBCC family protein [Ardenticatenales bacterium]